MSLREISVIQSLLDGVVGAERTIQPENTADLRDATNPSRGLQDHLSMSRSDGVGSRPDFNLFNPISHV